MFPPEFEAFRARDSRQIIWFDHSGHTRDNSNTRIAPLLAQVSESPCWKDRSVKDIRKKKLILLSIIDVSCVFCVLLVTQRIEQVKQTSMTPEKVAVLPSTWTVALLNLGEAINLYSDMRFSSGAHLNHLKLRSFVELFHMLTIVQ